MTETNDERMRHEDLAKQANRETWSLLERDDRTPADDEQMIHAAHASAHHWRLVGGAEVAARADWLLSRVYTVVGRPEAAQRYASLSLATCEREGIGDFDLAYAYEAMARSAAAAGEAGAATEWREQAEQAASAIENLEDQAIFTSDLVAGPWFALSR